MLGTRCSTKDGRNIRLCAFCALVPRYLTHLVAVIADRNASSDYVRFDAAPRGLARVSRDLVFAERWTHPDDLIEEWEHKSIKCAEVLVPDRVNATQVTGAYVSGATSQAALLAVAPQLAIMVNGHLFFR